MAREIDEQEPVPGQAAGERRHPDAGGSDAVDEQHRIAGARLQDTDPHGRRREVNPTFLHVEPIRRRDTLLGRPEPGLDPHARESYAERAEPSPWIACLKTRGVSQLPDRVAGKIGWGRGILQR